MRFFFAPCGLRPSCYKHAAVRDCPVSCLHGGNSINFVCACSAACHPRNLCICPVDASPSVGAGILFCLSHSPLASVFSRTCLACKWLTETTAHRYTVKQMRTKSSSPPADAIQIHRGSAAGCVPPSVYITFCVIVLSESHPGGFSTMVLERRTTVVFSVNRSAGVPSCRSLPRPIAFPCAGPPRHACGMSRF